MDNRPALPLRLRDMAEDFAIRGDFAKREKNMGRLDRERVEDGSENRIGERDALIGGKLTLFYPRHTLFLLYSNLSIRNEALSSSGIGSAGFPN